MKLLVILNIIGAALFGIAAIAWANSGEYALYALMSAIAFSELVQAVYHYYKD